MARQSTKSPARIVTPESVRRVNIAQFFQDVYAELKKVTWPSREETARLTSIVLIISLAVGATLAVIDFLFTQFFDKGIFRFVIPS